MTVLEREVYLGECPLHGWHGRTICPRCRELGQIAVYIRTRSGRCRLSYVSESLIRFRGGGREKVRQEARCRMCLRPRGPETALAWLEEVERGVEYATGSRPLTRHHIVPESWFKCQLVTTRVIRSTDANIVPLCRPCHDSVELDEEGRRMLRRVLGPDEIAFIIQLAGEEWLDERYPR